MKDSLKMKALESYMTLEKWIFQECNLERNRVAINLIFVTDMSSDEAMLSVGSGKHSSFSRFRAKKDFQEKKHLYDTVQILPPKTFKSLIDSQEIPTLHA